MTDRNKEVIEKIISSRLLNDWKEFRRTIVSSPYGLSMTFDVVGVHD